MLNRGTRLLLLLLFACKDKVRTKKEQTEYDKQKKEKSEKVRSLYFNYSKNLVGEREYYEVYKNANDSIENWVANNLFLLRCPITKPYQLDSLLCFNSKKDRFLSTVLLQTARKGSVQDYIIFYYGAKIKQKWYIFQGETLVLPREYYQDDIHKPLSWALMKQIAIEEAFRGYLIEVSSHNSSEKKKKYKDK